MKEFVALDALHGPVLVLLVRLLGAGLVFAVVRVLEVTAVVVVLLVHAVQLDGVARAQQQLLTRSDLTNGFVINLEKI